MHALQLMQWVGSSTWVRNLLISLMGQRLSQLLKASDIQLVDEEALRTEVEFGGEKHTLYNLLFSIDGLI